ncbi:Acetyltransferase (GNAT) family protein [Shimia sp. SK013]|uniref:GNAT family N-acetyltransferase n=1 Tax=Shimia sp. SK013 TaxID=1389006 RepID=UPI0006B5B762|nr:GNAT family N-acetyltransferase [Shimia sp. SK013]KPA23234.1 Acetyltransferase (GNAT) family protein [Shimia sp. SK013]
MTVFRNATFEELSSLLNWAADEGWNPGLEDVTPFWQADPHGFFVAEVEGELAATISVVNHTDDFAFLGLYIAKPEYRGQGVGYGLWQHALRHAHDRVVGLDGVPDQQKNYASSGFVFVSQTTRFSGEVPAKTSGRVCVASSADTNTMVDLESAVSGVRKPTYMQAWLQEAETRKTLIIRDGDEIAGFCTVRACQSGAKIGPLVATNYADAQALMSHAAAVMGTSLTVDVPQNSPALKLLCENIDLEPGFATARMYRGSPVQLADEAPAYFAVTSLELG